MSDRWRLFVAVELPPEVRAAIARAAELLPHAAGLRRTPTEQLHLTVLFIGHVAPETVPDIEARLLEVAGQARPLDATLTGFGRFPERGPARVVWVGLADAGRLITLAAATAQALHDLVPIEERPFRPHVTVARARDPIRLPPKALDVPIEPVRFAVDALTLFRSHLGAGGPRYEALGRWRFGTPTP